MKKTGYENFYFSTFFGSRLVGLFYLITLLFLLFNFKKMFFKNVENLTFFLVLLFLSLNRLYISDASKVLSAESIIIFPSIPSTIIELASVYKRLREFERLINDKEK